MTSISSGKPTALVHPALLQLLKFQARARLSRLFSGFGTPRRFVLSCVGLFLAAIWLGNVAVSIVMREATDPSRFRDLVALGFVAYALWHVVRNAVWRPEAGVHWTSAELEFVGGAPLSQRELLGYRFASIVTAATLKAFLISLLMLPDVHFWPIAFVGMMLALMMLDLIRMSVEITFHGVSARKYGWIWASVLTLAGGALISSLVSTVSVTGLMANRAAPVAVTLLTHCFQAAVALRETLPGRIVEAPFHPFVAVVTAKSMLGSVWIWLGVAAAMVCGMVGVVLWLKRIFDQSILDAERRSWKTGDANEDSSRVAREVRQPLPRIPRCGGVFTVAWRQVITVRNHWASLTVAVAPLAILSILPLADIDEPLKCFINVVGGLVFFAFIMLPSVFKLDFRRDLDHMLLLKMLPLSASSVVIGQLLVPVALATIFQITVLVGTALYMPIPVMTLVGTCLTLLPINMLVFALDNLIFVLYPYRAQQEGLEVFIRAVLILTGKGLLFAGALIFVITWSSMAQWTGARLNGLGPGLVAWQTIFAAGIFAICLVSSVVTTRLLVHAFRRFDPGQDVPA